jgi:nitrous oxidase accessory protein NosD
MRHVPRLHGSIRLLCAAPVSGLAALALTATAAGAAPAGSGTARPAVIGVANGQSIQAALDHARPGDSVVVQPGTYHEQLTIRTDGVTLRAGAVNLRPPQNPLPSACDVAAGAPSSIGLCVIGSVAPDGTVTDPASDVRVEGLRIAGFGVGISAQGTQRLQLAATSTSGSRGLGTSIASSTTPTIVGATSNDNGDTGFLLLGVSGGSISLSSAARNRGEGVLALNTTGVWVAGNSLSGNCSGVSVVSLGAPSGGLTIAGNLLNANNNLCLRNPGVNPQFGGIGVLLGGATDVNVVANVISNHAVSGDVDLPTGGVVSVSTAPFGGGDPARNRITRNRLTANTPDLFDDGTSMTTTYARNTCTSSVPAGLC